MTAKEYLRQARDIRQDIERKQNQIIILRAMSEKTTGSHEALRISGTKSRSKLEDAFLRIDAIEERLGRDIADFTEKYNEISAVVDVLENSTYRELLFCVDDTFSSLV